jgi:hypothetical protein
MDVPPRRNERPSRVQKRRFMRKHDHLGAVFPASQDLVDRVTSPETVHARERIVEHSDLPGPEIRKKEGERQSAAVAGAQGVLEAGPVGGRGRIPEVDRVLIDQDLIARARRAAAVSMRRCSDPEARVYTLKISIDALP